MPVRKLLVASQKSGIGKTTTSINLAAAAALAGTRVLLLDADPLSNVSTALHLGSHPFRRPLRQSGVDLPGALVCDVLPGLDVLSPYEAGACSDADFDDLLRLLTTPQFQASYGCLVVDAPPFWAPTPASWWAPATATSSSCGPNRWPIAPCRPFWSWCSARGGTGPRRCTAFC